MLEPLNDELANESRLEDAGIRLHLLEWQYFAWKFKYLNLNNIFKNITLIRAQIPPNHLAIGESLLLSP